MNAQTRVERRELLVRSLRGEKGLLLFWGNRESGMNYRDNTYAFRQDSVFLYYFGLKRPDLAALMDLESGETILFGDEYTVDDLVWRGPVASIQEEAGIRAGVERVHPYSDFVRRLLEARMHGRPVHYLPPYREEHSLLLWQWLGVSPELAARGASLPFIRAVAGQRNIKSAEEIVEIERAVTVSVEMHRRAMTCLRPGMREWEVQAEVEAQATRRGMGLSFPVIATVSGETLHNHCHEQWTREGKLFLLDCGAETAEGYAGDLSSTMPVGPRFLPRQREIYERVEAAHQAAVAKLAPGIPFREVHKAACRTLIEGLKDLGLMQGDTEEALEQGAHALFFPCGTGHLMGLDVHDMESLGERWVGYDGEEKSRQFGLKSLRLAMPLREGHVLTIEPGIYFIPGLISLWQEEGRHRDFIRYDRLESWTDFGGIRNEEDFLIVSGGARRLGPDFPKDIRSVETLRQEAFA